MEDSQSSSPFTTTSITAGLVYNFKVTSRNTVGSSLDSETITILAAKIPDAPINLVNVPGLTTSYQIGLDWQAGAYDGASPVIDYRLSYADDSGVYTVKEMYI